MRTGHSRWHAAGFAAALLLVVFRTAPAAPVTERRTLSMTGGEVVYYVTLPSNYNPASSYPMIQSILGWTHTESNAQNATRRFCYDPTPIATDHIHVCIWYQEGSWIYPHWSNVNAFEATIAVMNRVRADHLIDDQRMFLFAFSQGGNATEFLVWGDYWTAETFPYAGLIYCSAVYEGQTDIADPAVPRSLPVFIEYGDVSAGEYSQMPAYSQSLYDALAGAGYTDVEIHTIPGQGHWISDYYSGLNPNANALIATWWDRVNAQIVPSDQPPVIVAVEIDPDPGVVNEEVTFRVVIGGSATSIDWDFGDGSHGSGATTVHTYTSMGEKNGSVTASNDYGVVTQPFSLSVGSESTVVLPCVADCYVDMDSPAVNMNWESLVTLGPKDHSPTRGTVRDALIKFDLGGVPAGSNVSAATLRLYCNDDRDNAARFCTLHVTGVAQDWGETEATWQNRKTGVGWTGGAFVPGEGSNYDAGSVGSIENPSAEDWTGSWREIDVTALVQQWIGEGRENHGLAVQCYSVIGAGVSSPKRTDFSSREGGYPPELVVTYALRSAEPPLIASLDVNGGAGGDAGISWAAVSGTVYWVDYKDDLMLPTWDPLGSVTARESPAVMQDFGAELVDERFYRLRLE